MDNQEVAKKPKNIKLNSIYNLIYQVFLIVVPLVVAPYVSRVLSPNGIGQISFSNSIGTYFTVFALLGFSYYAQRELAKFQEDKHSQSVLFWEIIICRFLPVTICIATNLVLCMTGVYGDYTVFMYIYLINLASIYIDISFYFQGNEEFGKLVLFNVLTRTASIVCIFLFVNGENDAWIYFLITAVTAFITSIIMWLNLPKKIERVRVSEIKPLRHLKPTILLFIPTIASTIYTVLDKTLIGVLINETYVDSITGEVKKYSDLENGYYEQSDKIVKMLITIVTCLDAVMIPRNSAEYKAGNLEKVKDNMYKAFRFVWFIGVPFAFGLAATASLFVPWFFGDGYDKCVLLMSLMSPLFVIIGFSSALGHQYLISTDKNNKYTIALTTGALTNIVFSALLIYFWWSLGALIATLGAELIVVVMMFILSRKDISVKKVLIISWRYVLAGGAMFGVLMIIKQFFKPTIPYTLLFVFIGASIYFLILIITKDPMTWFGINKVKNIFHHIFHKKENEKPKGIE